jgi:hypothetical protein
MKTQTVTVFINRKPCIVFWALWGIFILVAVLLHGCAAPDPNADPVVVRAEQTLSIAFDSMDTFLKIEKRNAELVKQKVPEVHAFAESLRARVVFDGREMARGISFIESANNACLTYKRARAPDNRANLLTALKTLDSVLDEVKKHLASMPATKD